jgi:hypothetical protein
MSTCAQYQTSLTYHLTVTKGGIEVKTNGWEFDIYGKTAKGKYVAAGTQPRPLFPQKALTIKGPKGHKLAPSTWRKERRSVKPPIQQNIFIYVVNYFERL